MITSPLFKNINEKQIEHLLRCSNAIIKDYKKGEHIFEQGEAPKDMTVLVSGSIQVGKISYEGNLVVAGIFDEPGELFGEIYLYLENKEYDYFAQAITNSKVLRIPKEFLFTTCQSQCNFHVQLYKNLLEIFASKAYQLNQKVQILSGSRLRSRIARVLLMSQSNYFKKEEFAQIVRVSRPSLSRELLAMQEEGLITMQGKKILILNKKEVEKIAEM